MNLDQQIKDKILSKMKQFGVKSVYMTSVHNILAHSYSFYFIMFLFGIVLEFSHPIKSFNVQSVSSIGVFLLVISSVLIFWAQKTSRNLKKVRVLNEAHSDNFLKGPYRFSRRPTHLGLFLLMLGYGITTNSFWIILFACLSFVFTKYIFVRKEENILEKKYGEHYSKYKKIVNL